MATLTIEDLARIGEVSARVKAEKEEAARIAAEEAARRAAEEAARIAAEEAAAARIGGLKHGFNIIIWSCHNRPFTAEVTPNSNL